MKKTIILLTIVVVVVVGSYFAFAEKHMGEMMGEKARHGMVDSNDMMQKGMMEMHSMAGMIFGNSMVSAQDGGVIVLMGNRLLKYDSDLNFVKKIELEIDWEKCRQEMMGEKSGSE